ncbi:hypothetical protein HZB04_02185 [Candidatus Wolfebacteria bacterium]|nr:hypothetical protein [Candidatus Wolfebacteria bacterium]
MNIRKILTLVWERTITATEAVEILEENIKSRIPNRKISVVLKATEALARKREEILENIDDNLCCC